MLRIEITHSKNGVTENWKRVFVIGRTKHDKEDARALKEIMKGKFKNPMERLY